MNPQPPQYPYGYQPQPPKKATNPWVWLGLIAVVLLALGAGCAALLSASESGSSGVTTASPPKPMEESVRKRVAVKECRKALGMPDAAVFSDAGQAAIVMNDGSNKVIATGVVTSNGVRARWRCEIVVNDDFSIQVLEARLR